jgi:hypothetical protein
VRPLLLLELVWASLWKVGNLRIRNRLGKLINSPQFLHRLLLHCPRFPGGLSPRALIVPSEVIADMEVSRKGM